jgi:PD-(D/E)XK endonuclease
VSTLTTSQKGAAAEAEIAAAATRLGLVVLRPLCDGARYDLGIDVGSRIARVQCKWASLNGDVLTVRFRTCRRASEGYIRTTYSGEEIDALAVYSADTDRCYLLPIADVEHRSEISLRLAPVGNNQSRGVRWARDYELARTIERLHGSGRKDAGSPPAPMDTEAIR